MSKPPYVAWYPGDFLNGIIGMHVVDIGVYAVLLNMIYDHGGPIREDHKKIARRLGMRVDHFARSLETLVADEKIIRADGVIGNPRAEKELSRRTEKIAKLVSNFSARAAVPNENINKNNGSKSANGAQKDTPNRGTELDIDLEKRRKSQRAPPAPPQPRKNGHSRGTRIDPAWKLTTDHELYARHKGLTAREVKFEAEKFMLHYRKTTGDRALSNDWDASWQGWVLRACERLGREPTHFEHKKSGPETYTREDWAKVIDVFKKTTNWHPTHGPAPGTPGCLAPPDLVNHS